MLLVGLGTVSVLLDKTLRDLLRPESISVRDQFDEERFAAAANNPGPYRVHPDPLVSYVLKSGHETEFARATVRGNDWGLRERVAGPIPDDAFRIALLGDSVAFGQGLEGDKALAHQLEQVLHENRGETSPAIACMTVAIPGWNVRNAVHFLLDHLQELRPDLVVWIPVANDLEDTDGVFETGHRRRQPDLSTPQPWVPATNAYAYLMRAVLRLEQEGRTLTDSMAGPPALPSGLSPASLWRIADATQRIELLQGVLKARGVPLIVAPYEDHEVERVLRARLEERGIRLPTIPLFSKMVADDTLGFDPHPNAETTRTVAVWLAQELSQRGFLPGETSSPWPAIPPQQQERRTTVLEGPALAEWVASSTADARAALRPRIVPETGEGIRQIYGGLHPNNTFGHGLLVLLGGTRESLRVALAPLEDRPDLYPLEVEVKVDGMVVGECRLEHSQPETTKEFAIPKSSTGSPIEVQLWPKRWVAHRVGKTTRVASCRLLTVER